MSKTENKLFSICIPTNNRLESLIDTLLDLIPKIKKFKIKVYIYNNNPIDNKMEEYITTLKKSYPYVFYYKADKYRESDRNMEIVLKLSDTKYRLLLGDHYILYDDTSINKIYSFLNNNINYDAIILHYRKRLMFSNTDKLYTNSEIFLKELGWYIGMAATTIYSENMIERLPFKKYYDTNFTQALALLDYISNKEFQIQYISEDTIWSTKNGIKGTSSWHDRALEIFTHDWYNGVMSLPHYYSDKSKKMCIKNHSKMTTGFYSFKSLILYRYAGGLDIIKFFKYFKFLYYTTNIKIVFNIFIVSLIPKTSIKYVFKESYSYIQQVLGGMDKYN